VGKSGFDHVCLHVRDVEAVMTKRKQREVTVIFDTMARAPDSGVKCASFIADPWVQCICAVRCSIDTIAPGSVRDAFYA
jgi:hypothetical protein